MGTNGNPSRPSTYDLSRVAIALQTEAMTSARVPDGMRVKPFGGYLPQGAITVPADHKGFLQERFGAKAEIAGQEFVADLASLVAYFADEALALDLNKAQALTVAIEYVLAGIVIPPTDVTPFNEYARTVIAILRPAYKVLNAAGKLVESDAFASDFGAKTRGGEQSSTKAEINRQALEAFRTIQRCCDGIEFPHIAALRGELTDVTPVFANEQAWKALRGVDAKLRPAVIDLLKTQIATSGNVVVNRTIVISAENRVRSNQAQLHGAPTGVNMAAWFAVARHMLGDYVAGDQTERKASFAGLATDKVARIVGNMRGYVPHFTMVLGQDGSITFQATIRDSAEESASAIGTSVNLCGIRPLRSGQGWTSATPTI